MWANYHGRLSLLASLIIPNFWQSQDQNALPKYQWWVVNDLEWKKTCFIGELNLFGLGWHIDQHYSVVMAAGILRLGDLWVNWLAISPMGARVRDGTQTLSQRGFQFECWICKWPPTCSFDNSLMIIMRHGLLWWLKLRGIGKGITRLTKMETMLSRHNVFVCVCLPASVQLVWATWLSSGQWDVSRNGINQVWAWPLEASHMISQQLSSVATINLGHSAPIAKLQGKRSPQPPWTSKGQDVNFMEMLDFVLVQQQSELS